MNELSNARVVRDRKKNSYRKINEPRFENAPLSIDEITLDSKNLIIKILRNASHKNQSLSNNYNSVKDVRPVNAPFGTLVMMLRPNFLLKE